jgi:hypothetical protein
MFTFFICLFLFRYCWLLWSNCDVKSCGGVRILCRAFSHLPAGARGIGLVRISGEVEPIFKELCRGLNARHFSHVAQKYFVDVLCEV